MNIFIIIAFMAVIAVLAYLSLGFGAALVGYGLIKAKLGSSPKYQYPVTPPTPAGVWKFLYGRGEIGTPENFTFPATDGVHYCVKGAAGSGIALGKTITFKFEIGGDGELKVADPSDIAPATVRLFLQRNNDDLTKTDYRFWNGKTDLQNGVLTMTALIDPSQWTNVYGQNSAAGFQALLNDLMHCGFTFGGQYFAGHGVYCPSGTRTFKLLEYSVT